MRAMLWNAAVAAALVLGAEAAWAESRVALVVGQSAYRAVPALPNPANDAKAVEKLLGEAGFEVTAANDLTQTELRQMVGDFAAKIAAKGPDTVALMFYAGHGIQVDGENYLIPIDIDPKRETDIPLQAVRLDDVLNTLTSVPTRSRIVMLDACRNNPFPEIRKTTGQGLALVDTKTGSPGTFVSFSTSPGAEAEDGGGANSPYTTALLEAGRKSGLQIEDTFKRVRLAVNKATEGRQTPWDSSSLIDDFRFFGASEATAQPAAQPEKKRTVEEWRSLLKGKKVEEANELIVSDGTVDAYEAFVSLFAEPPLGTQAKRWLDRHRRMQAWNKAVLANTASAYKAFLDQYPESDLTVTARKLELRLRNKPEVAVAVPVATSLGPTPVAALTPASGATCPCSTPPTIEKKADKKPEKSKPKRAERDEPKRTASKPPRGRVYYEDDVDDVVVVRRPPPDYYDVPRGPAISIGGGFRGGRIGPRGPTGGNIGGGSRGGRY